MDTKNAMLVDGIVHRTEHVFQKISFSFLLLVLVLVLCFLLLVFFPYEKRILIVMRDGLNWIYISGVCAIFWRASSLLSFLYFSFVSWDGMWSWLRGVVKMRGRGMDSTKGRD